MIQYEYTTLADEVHKIKQILISRQVKRPAEFKHINKQRKRN
jgi:hypothetical protein